MTNLVTVLAALLILSPFVVLALRTTRWDPLARGLPPAPDDDRDDADARRTSLDLAALRDRTAPLPEAGPGLVRRLPAPRAGVALGARCAD